MCASPRQPEDEATDAAQRVLEEEEEARLASASLAAGDPTGWFDRLYAAGARGQVPVPWRRRQPHPLLANWASARELSEGGQRAVVVGCGLGADAEYVAAIGFDIMWTSQGDLRWSEGGFGRVDVRGMCRVRVRPAARRGSVVRPGADGPGVTSLSAAWSSSSAGSASQIRNVSPLLSCLTTR